MRLLCRTLHKGSGEQQPNQTSQFSTPGAQALCLLAQTRGGTPCCLQKERHVVYIDQFRKETNL